MSPAWSMLIQYGTANDLPSIGDPGKDDVNIVPGGWNRMRVPSGDITVPSVLFMLQVGAYWLQLSLECQPATMSAALASSEMIPMSLLTASSCAAQNSVLTTHKVAPRQWRVFKECMTEKLPLPFGRGDRGCLIAAKCITAGEFRQDPRRSIRSSSSPNWGMTLVISLREIRRQEIRLKDVALCEPPGVSQVGQHKPYCATNQDRFGNSLLKSGN
jgi:hypothetical protein